MEYALVLVAFMAMVVALAALWHAGREGRLVDRAVEASSHSFASGLVDGSRDLLLY